MSEKSSDCGRVNVNIRGYKNVSFNFTLKRDDPLKVVLDTYCLRLGETLHSVGFRINGRIIDVYETPRYLNVEEGETIYVNVYKKTIGRPEIVTLEIYGCDLLLRFWTPKTDPIKIICEKYCERIGVATSGVFFRLKKRILDIEKSALALNLTNGDKILCTKFTSRQKKKY